MAWRRRGKFNAKRTTVGKLTFASKKESERYVFLKALEKAGKIKELELQPRFPITVVGADGCSHKICTYVADFRYKVGRGKKASSVVEDVKGVKTSVYRIKKKLVEAVYGIQVTEV